MPGSTFRSRFGGKIRVDRTHIGFDSLHEGIEVVFVRHALGWDRCEDLDPDLTGEEELRSGPRHAVRSLDHDGQHGKLRIDRDAECSLLEGEHFTLGASCPLGEHKEGVAAFCRDLDTFVDCLARRACTRLAIDLDDADCPHRRTNDGDFEHFLLGQEAALNGQHLEQQRDVELAQVIRRNDVPGLGIDVLEATDVESARWQREEDPCPMVDDAIVKWRGRIDPAVHDDDRGKNRRVDGEQWDEQHGASCCKKGPGHGSSVDAGGRVFR